MQEVKVKVKRLSDNAVIPFYAHNCGTLDMGMDMTAVSYYYDEELDAHVYGTGLAFELPQGYGMFLFPRSSVSKTEAYLTNSVGVVDPSYRGEVSFKFRNRDASNKKKPYNVGDRIGQLVVMPYPSVTFIETDTLEDSVRGEGGYGSTGK